MLNNFALDLKTPYLLFHVTKLGFVISNHYKKTGSETVFLELVKLLIPYTYGPIFHGNHAVDK